MEGYVAWAHYTVLTKVVYICLLKHQNTVSCPILGQFVLYNLWWENTWLTHHLNDIWHCLALFVSHKLGISVSSNWLNLQINICYSHITWFVCADKGCLYLFVKSSNMRNLLNSDLICSILWVLTKSDLFFIIPELSDFFHLLIYWFIIWTMAKYFQNGNEAKVNMI